MLQRILNSIFGSSGRETGFQTKIDSEGLNFYLPNSENLQECTDNNAPCNLLYQYTYLKMLEEQGLAFQIPNGFVIPVEDAVRLSDEIYDFFDVPKRWDGIFQTRITSITSKPDFSIQIIPVLPDGSAIHDYEIKGPCLKISDEELFLLKEPEFQALKAVESYTASLPEERDEHFNLDTIFTLQQAREAGASIDTSHFKKFHILKPEKVGVAATEISNGDLVLTPVFPNGPDPSVIDRRLGGYINSNAAKATMNAENFIILLDERRMQAIKEILNNRAIKKEQIVQFLKTPTAFLDASLVDLDTGFSMRVRGSTVFRHAYFGETDRGETDWFNKGRGAESYLEPHQLDKILKTNEDIEDFAEQFEDACDKGASELIFKDKIIDISDKEAVRISVENVRRKLEEEPESYPDESTQQAESEPKVVDIILNDSDLEIASNFVKKKIENVLFRGELDWTNFLRKPFPHQEEAVRWILGLALPETKKNQIRGGLLADDMGLGKTFASLAAVYHFAALKASNDINTFSLKPVLVVAPLSLLDTWKQEIEVTFKKSPFNDVVILQGDADLKKFKIAGAGPETKSDDGIKYALKIGPSAGPDRLDMPNRLVLTTYQTLRDYQFSLCKVDWSFAIFDEAQNIKNPNALQTRAAKGIKAEFILLATGTPVENKLVDFWCLMDTAQPGLLGSYQQFREKYIMPINRAAEDEIETVKAKTGRALRENTAQFMLRRVKEDHIEGLPEKKIFVGLKVQDEWNYLEPLDSTMTGKQRDVYEEIIKAVGSKGYNDTLSALHRLRDASLHPALVEGGVPHKSKNRKELKNTLLESGKLYSLLSVLDEIKKNGEKVIIFLVNKRLQSFLSVSLSTIYGLQSVSIINGDVKAVGKKKSTVTRHTIIEEFQQHDGFNIIIMSPIAAGVGLTITSANNVIHLERHWNPAKEAQATDRVYRIGQKKDVNIYIPILHHPEFESFDVNLHRLLWQKTTLKDAVVTVEQVLPQPTLIDSDKGDTAVTAENLSELSWKQFEALVAELFAREYDARNVWLTPISNDYGADVVIQGRKKSLLIQCKFTRHSTLHSQTSVRDLISAPVFYENWLNTNFDMLLVVTNAKKISDKTRRTAESLKKDNRQIEFCNHDKIAELLEKYPLYHKDLFHRLNMNRLHLRV